MKKYLAIVLSLAYLVYGQNFEFNCDIETDCTVTSDLNRPAAIPDPENCSNFYACDAGTLLNVSLTCGENRFFDGEENPPQCKDEICTEPRCSLSSILTCPSSCGETESFGTIANPNGECNQFYYCGNSLISETCPDDNFPYYSATGCVADADLACCERTSNIPSCTGIDDFITIPDPISCQSYYLCLGEVAMPQHCQDETTSFDIHSNECISSSDATCGNYKNNVKNDGKSQLHMHSYENPVCIDISVMKCPSNGNFPICFTCYNSFAKCDNLEAKLITCSEGEYFPPAVGSTECMPMEECRVIEDKLFSI